MANKLEGQRVPDVNFRARQGDEWVNLTTKDIFGGKNVVCFSLPGAFTPTCSSRQLPRYNELAPDFRNNGVDEIVCISVNDGFVMEAWKKDQKADNVKLVPDGNGEFTEKMGMLVDKADLGFGRRSWRYSMLVRDGVIEKMFVEPEKPGDPYEVSDPDTMLAYLNPALEKQPKVSLFTKPGCPHCARAKKLLSDKGYQFEEIVLGRDITSRSLLAVSGAETVPQVFVDGECIGSADALEEFLKSA